MNLYQNEPFYLEYNQELYNFRQLVQKLLGENDLEHLHKFHDYSLLDRAHDQSTIWHKKYYDQFLEFQVLYVKLITDFIKPILGLDKIVFQRIPTFRVHLVGNVAVGEWHKDKTYNHGSTEVNFWMPFTHAYGNNSIWIESKEDLRDFKPYEVKPGQIFVFDGANLNHGNKLNDTETCRISVDFRIVDFNKFNPSQKGSINMHTPFDIGGYFDVV